MKKIHTAVLTAAAFALLSGAAQAAFTDMTINGEKVPKARLEAVYNAAVRAGATAGAELEARVKRDVTEETVLLQEAAKAKVERTQAYKDALDRVTKQLRLQVLLSEYVKAHPASDKEVREAYDNAKAIYGDTEYRVSHIMVKTEKEAKDLIARLNKGEKFDDLARRYSQDSQTGPKGGDLGWMSPSRVEPAIANAFKVLTPGAVAQSPIQNQHGWHVVKLEEKRAQKDFPSYESQKENLRSQLSQLAARKHFAEIVQKAKVR